LEELEIEVDPLIARAVKGPVFVDAGPHEVLVCPVNKSVFAGW